MDLLQEALERFCSFLDAQQWQRIIHAMGRPDFRLSSACTGSGAAEAVHVRIARHCKVPARVGFSCESVPWKRAFFKKAFESQAACTDPHQNSPCMFCNICDLRLGEAHCEIHGRVCAVPKGCYIFACGFSCKDFSRLSLCWVLGAGMHDLSVSAISRQQMRVLGSHQAVFETCSDDSGRVAKHVLVMAWEGSIKHPVLPCAWLQYD